MNKTRAFTVFDVLISMLLMILVTGTGLTAFSIISREFHSYRQREKQIADLEFFKLYLEQKFSTSAYVFFSGEYLVFTDDDLQADSVLLNEQSAVISGRKRTDSLTFVVMDIRPEFLPGIIYKNTMLLQTFNCVITSAGRKFPVSVTKKYAADIYMNQEVKK